MQTRTKPGRAAVIASTLLAGMILLAGSALPSVARAQATQTDARWQPWLGCWEPSRGIERLDGGATGDHMLCVLPVEGSAAVELATVDSERVLVRERVDANGEHTASDVGGCKGWKSAAWSPTGEQLYLKSDYDCGGGLKRSSTGIFAMAPGGVWLDVQGVSARNSGGVRVIRYRSVPAPDVLRDELARVTAERELALSTARTAASGSVSAADVVRASRAVDPAVVEAWLIERRQRFAVDADQLVALSDSGVPSRVIDAMVALSYPKKFAIAGSNDIGMQTAGNELATYEQGLRTTHSLMMYPYGYGFGFGYDYSPYGYYSSPYGYSPYGYGYGWYPGGGPVVIIRNPEPVTTREHGKVVNGRGYTRGERSSDNGSSNRGSRSSGARNDPSPSNNNTGSSASPAQSGAQSTGRTAKPRKP